MLEAIASSTTMSRRTLMAGAAALAAVATVGSGAAAQVHPDAELLAAFEAWRKSSLVYEALPLELSDVDRAPYWVPIDAAVEAIADLPALTVAGVAVKLAYLFASVSEDQGCYSAVWHGTHPSAESLDDHNCRLLWTLLTDVRRMEKEERYA